MEIIITERDYFNEDGEFQYFTPDMEEIEIHYLNSCTIKTDDDENIDIDVEDFTCSYKDLNKFYVEITSMKFNEKYYMETTKIYLTEMISYNKGLNRKIKIKNLLGN